VRLRPHPPTTSIFSHPAPGDWMAPVRMDLLPSLAGAAFLY